MNLSLNNLNLGITPTRIFCPSCIQGLQLWLDAADASTITLNGSNVSQWDDKSGNNNHAEQGTASSQPLYSGGEIVYDGGDFMTNPLAYDWNSNEFTIYTVQENDTSSAQFRGVLGNRFGTGAGSWFTIGHNFTESFMVEQGDPVGNLELNPVFNDALQPIFISTFIKENTPKYTIRKNNGSENSSLIAHDIGDTTNDLRIGEWFNAARWIGTINEIIIINKKVTSTENTKIINYLSNKWGISI